MFLVDVIIILKNVLYDEAFFVYLMMSKEDFEGVHSYLRQRERER
jgi:hypothetical protein